MTAHRGPGELLRKLLALAPADRRLLAAAAALLGMSSLGLGLLPVQRLRLLLRLAATRLPGARRRADAPERVRWALAVVRRLLPGARCLAQALAAEALLAHGDFPARLRIGVPRAGRPRRLAAHAWLELDGKVVVGGARAPSTYEPVPVSFMK